jgi:hypothetical protein
MKPLFQAYLVENNMPSIIGKDLHKKISRDFHGLMKGRSNPANIKVVFEIKSPTMVRGELMYVDHENDFHCTFMSESIESVSVQLASDMLSKLDSWEKQTKTRSA